MKKLSLVIAVAVVLTVFSACSTDTRYSETYLDFFDTVTEFTAYTSSRDKFNEAKRALYGELSRLNALFDAYSDHEDVVNIKTVNDNAGKVAVAVDDDLIRLVEFGKAEYTRSGGKLNIAMGAVTKLWKDCLEKGVLPDASALSDASLHCDIEKVVVSGNTIYLEDPDMRLDVGAVAKGYASACAVELLHGIGVENFAINLGGNTATSGKKPNGPWRIGIQNPNGGILTALDVTSTSVVTSGDYQRFVTIDGKNYHHIIDPETLYPCENYRSVTVICIDHALADALSTELFLLDIETGKKILKDCGAEAMWVLSDGTLVRSEIFERCE